jgi:RND family efflux transporter MFP subunit
MKTQFYTLILAGLFLTSCGSDEKATTEPRYRPVKYITLNAEKLGETFSFSGVSQSESQENLSFKVGGTVESIPVKVGSVVQKGDLLIRLDATDYQVALNQARAAEKSAKSNFVASKSGYERALKLYETKSISLNDFEKAKAQYEAAKSNFEAAQSQTEAAQNQVNYSTLRATFDGIISAVDINENEVVSPGRPVVTLSSSDQIQIEVGLPENAIAWVSKGQKVDIVFSSIKSEKFVGTVEEVGFTATGATYPVTVLLDDPSPLIRPDMPAEVTFTKTDLDSQKKPKTILPSTSVGEDADGNFVYVLEKTDQEGIYTTVKTPVKVGVMNEVGFELLTDIPNGALVASAGLNMLREGALVKLYEQE